MKTTQMHMYLFSISHIFLIYSLVFIECKKKAGTYREKQEPVHSPCTGFSSILFILYCPSSLTALIGVL